MTTAHARAVPFVFANLRNALLATASAGLLIALTPTATAAPNCTGTGAADTCIIDLTNIAAENVDAGAGTDTLQFNAAGLTLNANDIGGTGTRLANFEAAEITAGSSLTLTGGVLLPPGASRPNLTWTVAGTGSLFISGGNAIGDGSAVIVNGLFELTSGAGIDNSETIGSLAGSGSVVLQNASTLIAGGNGQSTTFSGVISNAGVGGSNFTKAGSGKLIFTGANTFGGRLTVSGGTLEIGNANAIANANSILIAGGELTGTTAYTINAPSGVSITSGRITGNATINGNVSSNGGLQPGNTSIPPGSTAENPGQDMGQITINGDYTATGAGAYVGMFINIDAAAAGGAPGTSHDFLAINGNITGTTPTTFAMASFLPATAVGVATTGNGIHVINITGLSANEGNDFVQRTSLVAGPFQYLLRYVANHTGSQDGYFLQSAARDEIHGHAALLSAGQSLIRGCFRDDQRIPDSPKGATYGRAWFGYRQGSTSFGADTGIEMDQDFSCSTGGMDWRMGHGWFGGVSGGFGSSNGDFLAPATGVAQLDGDARVIEAYAAFTSSAFFLNLSAGYADMDWNYIGRLGANAATSGGFIGSAQAGIGLGLEPIAVKLIGMISYDGTNCGDTCFGFTVTEDTGLIEAKGALRFDGVTWGGSVRPWAQVGYSTVLSDGVNTITGGPFTVAADTNDALLTIDAGLQTYLDENLSIYLDGGYNESLNKDISGYRAGIGAKLYW